MLVFTYACTDLYPHKAGGGRGKGLQQSGLGSGV